MERHELGRAWAELVESQKSCRKCTTACKFSLIQEGAKPLFGRFEAWRNGVLFLFEAPNPPDTFDADKGYMTYDRDTDETSRFTRRLMLEELGLEPRFFQATNSVLCLPLKKLSGKHTVTDPQRRMCLPLVREQIRVLDPLVVVSIGYEALKAARNIENHPYENMRDAAACPVQWAGRWLFPVYHTGMIPRNAENGRTPDAQRKDWRQLREFLRAQGVVMPSGEG